MNVTARTSFLAEPEKLSQHAVFEIETSDAKIEVTIKIYKDVGARLVVRRVSKKGNHQMTIYPSVSNQIEVKI